MMERLAGGPGTLRFAINLLADLSVVTRDGEYLGTWDTDESDAIYEFTLDASSEVLISDLFMGPFCKRIQEWHESREAVTGGCRP